jgi:hypothetical protein
MKVEIDGVPYAPVTEAHPAIELIARALAGVFWGDMPHMSLDELLDGLTVSVNDNGDGEPIRDVLAAIVSAIK